MDLDGREVRLRSRFGFMMCWSALAIIGPGSALGVLLEGVVGTAGRSFWGPGGQVEPVAMVAGHALAGLVVIATILRSYLAPCPPGNADGRR